MRIKFLARTTWITFNILVSCSAMAQAPEEPTQIYWSNSPQMAQSLAMESRQPILAFITSENCSYCRKMEREVWTNQRIIAQVERDFIPLKLNATQHRQFVAKLGVHAFPTTIVFTPEGKIIGGAPGFMPASQMAGLLNTARPNQVSLHQLPTPR